MNIGILHNNNNNYGGIENQILSLCDFMIKRHDIIFFTTIENSVITKEMKDRRIQIILLKGSLFRQILQIKKAIKKYKIKILQLHTFDNSIKYRLSKLLCPNLKIVVRVHTYIACSWIASWKKKTYYLIDGLSSFLVEKFIVNGTYLKKEMLTETIIKASKIATVIDGTKPIKYSDYIITKNDLPNLKMIMVANVIRHKGHDVLIKGLASLKRNGIIIKCDIFGDTNRDLKYTEELLSMVSKLGLESQVFFKGFSNTIHSKIQNYPIICLPSDSEGTPNCIMEGMSVKRLVVVSDTGGVSEMVLNGKTGFTHKPCDVEDFCRVIKEIAFTSPDKLNSIMTNGYKFWKSELSIDQMCYKFNDIYNDL